MSEAELMKAIKKLHDKKFEEMCKNLPLGKKKKYFLDVLYSGQPLERR